MRFGGFYTRDHAVDGFSLGVTGAAGAYTFGGAKTGNSFSDLLLGLPLAATSGSTRAALPLDAIADEFGGFVQDDWKVSEASRFSPACATSISATSSRRTTC